MPLDKNGIEKAIDRKSVEKGKSVNQGGNSISKKKKKNKKNNERVKMMSHK